MSTSSATATPTPAPRDPWRMASSRAIHPSARDPHHDEALVTAIAEGLAAVSVPWELATGESPDERRDVQLLATDLYDAWLVHWPAGSSTEVHDHAGSDGAIAVVCGVLDEVVHHVSGATTTTRLVAGRSTRLDTREVHSLHNRGSAAVTAVHVYSPPLHSLDGSAHDATVSRP